jgi:REP element-mobilizing transposase RayT
VSVRVREGLPTLRSQSMFGCVLAQVRAAKQRFLRIVHFSVQSNHIHLLVEADNRALLTRGMKGFAVRVARGVNRLLGCRGSVWADRCHVHTLRTPREVRNALVYVISNWVKHGGWAGIDPCSSARYLDGLGGETLLGARARASPAEGVVPASDPNLPVVRSETWLLRAGWKRHGMIDPTRDRPAARPTLR